MANTRPIRLSVHIVGGSPSCSQNGRFERSATCVIIWCGSVATARCCAPASNGSNRTCRSVENGSAQITALARYRLPSAVRTSTPPSSARMPVTTCFRRTSPLRRRAMPSGMRWFPPRAL